MRDTDIPYRPAYAHAGSEFPPQAHSVEQHVLDWADAQQLITDADFHAQLINSKFGWLATRCYPYAPIALLHTIADFLAWLYIVDDRFFDRTPRVSSTIISDVSAIWSVLGQHAATQQAAPLLNAWRDICARLRKQLGSVWFHHFANGVGMMYGANVLQIIGHLHDLSIDKHAYEILRYHNSGLVPCFDFYGLSEGFQLSDEDRYCTKLQTLSRHANIIIALSNDIQSHTQEAEQRGGYENLVCLYVNEGCTLKEAINRVSNAIKQHVDSFDALSEPLIHTATPAVQRYINELQHWIIGYQYWAFNDSSRYAYLSANDT